jgi:ribosomal protein L37AE/L43A
MACEVLRVVTPPDFTLDVVLYGLLVLGVFGVLWIYYDRRDRALYDAQRRKITFHCIRCDHLYTEKAGTDTAPCPKCGHVNTRLKF